MKKLISLIAVLCLALSLCACSSLSSPSAAETEAPVDEYLVTAEPDAEASLAPIATPETSSSAEPLYDADTSAQLLSGEIDGQSYGVTLSGWDNVRFTCVAPTESDEDVRFYLVDSDSDCIVFEFPATSDGNILEGVEFGEILDVLFSDFDSDGRDDIIVRLSYAYPSGRTYNSVVLFSQPEGEDAFVHNKYSYPNLAAYLILGGMVDSMDAVQSGIDSYWAYRDEYQSDELKTLLAAIASGVQPGSSGCSLRAAEYACNMLDFAAESGMSEATANSVTGEYLSSLDDDARAVLVESLSMVEDARATLQSADNSGLLSDIGLTSDDFTHGSTQYPAVSGIMSAAGVA